MRIFLAAWILFTSVIQAPVPSEDTKIKALKCAAFINGGSFGLASDGRPYAMIDVSKMDLDKCQ
jgi:hypothetical protein